MTTYTVHAPDGVPEVGPGDDLAALLLAAVGRLESGDVVLVTSKVVAKAEGRVVEGTREEWLAAETDRVVARRGPLSVVRTRTGLTLAAAGIDASHVAVGHVVLLPVDPDASARRLRATLQERTGAVVGVIVTDTAGRAWRAGQTDLAVGAAGVAVSTSYAGRVDAHGNTLRVTEPAVADELAGAAELAQGKLGGRPFAVVRGLTGVVLPVGDDGPGAAALVRAEGEDLFGYGAREAVVAALTAARTGRPDPVFGAPADPAELTTALARALGVPAPDGLDLVVPATLRPLAAAVAAAYGYVVDGPPPSAARDGDAPVRLRFRPVSP